VLAENMSLGADIGASLKVNQLNPSGTSALRFTNLLSRLLDQVRLGSRPCISFRIDEKLARRVEEKRVVTVPARLGFIKFTIDT
jgi:hypothetical protein